MNDEYLRKVRMHYPTAERSELLGKELVKYIYEHYGLPPEKIMAANSICSDDVNAMQFPHSVKDFLGPFNMGGLNGFPFTGLTGMKAFFHHVPKDGALLIFYAPHIGINKEGKPGLIKRVGQPADSSCCGAAVGALPKPSNGNSTDADADIVPPNTCENIDYQMDCIKLLFERNKPAIIRHPFPIVAATQVMYDAINKRIHELVDRARNEMHCEYLFLVGGIFINGDAGEGSFVDYKHGSVIRKPHEAQNNEADLLHDFLAYHNKNL